MAAGSTPYLTAKADPYDGVVRDQSWSVPLSSAMISAACPSIGDVRSVQVLERDGDDAGEAAWSR